METLLFIPPAIVEMLTFGADAEAQGTRGRWDHKCDKF